MNDEESARQLEKELQACRDQLSLMENLFQRMLATSSLTGEGREKLPGDRSQGQNIVFLNPDFTIGWGNEVAAKSAGLAPRDLVGRRCHEVWRQRSAPCPDCLVAKTLSSGEKQESRVATPGGKHWHVLTEPAYDQNGRVKGVVKTALDVTGCLALLPEFLQTAKERDLILSSILDLVVFYKSPDLTISWANQAAARSVGLDASRLEGRRCYEFWGPRNRPCPGCPVQQVFATGKPAEKTRLFAGGRSWRMRAFPAMDKDGGLIGVVEIGRETTELDKSRQELQISRQRIESMIRYAPVGIVFTDHEQNITEVNPAFCELLGFEPEELVGLSFHSLSHAEDASREQTIMNHAPDDQGFSYALEKRLFRKDGGQVWVSLNASMVRGARPHEDRFFAFVKDITRRKEAENVRSTATEILLTVLNSLEAHVFVADMNDCEVLFANKAMQRDYGCDIVGESCWKVFGHSKAPCDSCPNPTLLDSTGNPTGHSRTWEGLVPRTGRWYQFHDRAISWVDRRLARLRMAVDITDRREIEEALRRSEQNYRGLFDNAAIGVFRSTSKGRFRQVNRAMAAMLGYDAPEEVVARITNIAEQLYVHPESRREILDFTASEHHEAAFEKLFRRKNGEHWYGRLYMRKVEENPEDGMLFEGFVEDITRQMNIAHELLEAKTQAEAANRAKNEFLATMSHEVRTPLSGIMGMLQVIDQTELGEENRTYLRNALEASRNLLRILSDILDISRIEAGKLELLDTEFSPSDLVTIVLEALKMEADAKGLILSSRIDPSLPPLLRGDVERLRQILFNLLGNALRYTERGRVSLELYALPFCATPGGVSLHIAVTDSGAGIEDKQLATIFESFARGPQSHKISMAGAGLGLAIVRKLIQAMRGSLAISSELGRGTEVHVTLPIHVPKRSKPARVAPPRKTSEVACRVLLVEDDTINRMAVTKLLKGLGCQVLALENGREALDAIAGGEMRFDIVFMDIQMPVMDGVEATRRIRALPGEEANIPIVAMTAFAMRGDRERFLAEGMNDYLSKPVEVENLRRALSRQLAGGDDAKKRG